MNLLDRDDLPTLLTGCIQTQPTATGLLLRRLTQKQLAHFESLGEPSELRARCAAGVMLCIDTDSPTLDLTGRVLTGARTYAGFDVEVDGRVIEAHRIETSPETRTLRLFDLPTGPSRRIVVTFPQSAIVELDALTLASGSKATASASDRKKYLAIGDSITHGMDARRPSSAYAVQLARLLQLELLNVGVGGHDDDLPFKPDLVTIAYGTNDWSRGTSQAEIAATVEQYLTRLLESIASAASVYVLTPIWRQNGDEAKPSGTLVEFSGAIATAASSFDPVTVVDGTTLVPHLPDLYADGVHPTDEGFLHYTINLRRAIGSAS
jgi:lysophospholipase L1-like esterase